MGPLRRAIHEVHRRSLWQIISIYLAASWVVLQVVESLTDSAGLPDWVPAFALVLLLLGLPMVLATAFVQEGMPGGDGEDEKPRQAATVPNLAAGTGSLDLPSTRSPAHHRLFTWRNFAVGGVAALVLLATSVGGYFFMRSAGIGPVASLVAQGVFDEREPVVLADFENRTDDEGLGDVVTQAFRVDLVQSPALRVLDPVYVAEVLDRMQMEGTGRLTPALAREAAVRDGIKAVIQGEVGRAGEGYVLTASIVAAEDGRTLAAFRQAADDDSGVLEAIDRLSQDVREKAGESLRSIKGEEPLEQVTTASLPALRLFTQADRAFERGELQAAISLLEEAVAIDPEFAMAWRRMAVALSNTGIDRSREVRAATRAYELRDRLTEKERHLATAFYHSQITQERDEVIAAYRRVLALDPDDRRALNNLANAYSASDDLEAAGELYRRAVNGPGVSSTAFQNLVDNRVASGRLDEAMEVVVAWEARYPGHLGIPEARGWVLLAGGDPAAAIEVVRPHIEDASTPTAARVRALDLAARAELWRGRIGKARELLATAERLAEQQSASSGWGRTLWAAYYESWVGDRERAAAPLLAALEDGRFDALPATARFHFFTALDLAMVGRSGDEVEEIARRWRAEVPPEMRGRIDSLYFEVARSRVDLARGDAAAAAVRIESVREAMPCRKCFNGELGEAYLAAGRIEDAIRELESAAALEDNFPEVDTARWLRAIQLLGPAYEQAGDTARALDAYRRFTDRWADADPELQPRVREARQRIAALGG